MGVLIVDKDDENKPKIENSSGFRAAEYYKKLEELGRVEEYAKAVANKFAEERRDEHSNMFADAFGGKLSTEEESLRYIREHGDLVSSDPIKKQIAIDKIIDKVLYGKKDKPKKTFEDNVIEQNLAYLDKLHEIRRNFSEKKRNNPNVPMDLIEIIHWIFIIYGITYSIAYIFFNYWS